MATEQQPLSTDQRLRRLVAAVRAVDDRATVEVGFTDDATTRPWVRFFMLQPSGMLKADTLDIAIEQAENVVRVQLAARVSEAEELAKQASDLRSRSLAILGGEGA